ncbi:MAG: P-II family nitrogen regulator [Clostridiales bacterium]|nr:P-II family nitrogen regulator [Clostridiales bacterium]
MENINENLILFCSILNFGKGSKALKLSKELGALGGTIFLGRGTVREAWLNFLGTTDLRKEIFITIINKSLEDKFYEAMINEFHLDKHHKGIAFSMPLKYCINCGGSRYDSKVKKEGVNNMDYESIFVIVNKGLSTDVLEAAESAGSTGGTVIHGRGSGTQEKAKLFNIEIEPEKDIVLILSKKENTDNIVKVIDKKLDIEKPGAGIIFVMDVSRTLGLYKG